MLHLRAFLARRYFIPSSIMKIAYLRRKPGSSKYSTRWSKNSMCTILQAPAPTFLSNVFFYEDYVRCGDRLCVGLDSVLVPTPAVSHLRLPAPRSTACSHPCPMRHVAPVVGRLHLPTPSHSPLLLGYMQYAVTT